MKGLNWLLIAGVFAVAGYLVASGWFFQDTVCTVLDWKEENFLGAKSWWYKCSDGAEMKSAWPVFVNASTNQTLAVKNVFGQLKPKN